MKKPQGREADTGWIHFTAKPGPTDLNPVEVDAVIEPCREAAGLFQNLEPSSLER
jgi:hypothetical protein